jgi:gamma-glutamyltranspeptidase/glutathione hydrolase
MKRWVGVGLGAVAAAGCFVLAAVAPPPEVGAAMVAADQELASRAGAEVLRDGGNAADAAAAAALAAGVVQPAGSGLGGGGFAVGRVQGHPAFSLDFREIAPAGADRTFFLGPDGAVVPGLSTIGGKAVAVPQEARGLAALVRDHGRLPLARVARPAIRLASQGFPVGPHLAGSLASTTLPSVQALLSVDGHPARRGEILKRPDLAKALDQWARTGGDFLNVGPGAAAVVQADVAAGGVLTLADLAGAKPKERPPLTGRFGRYRLVTMGPPSSGGVAVLEILQVLQGYDLAALGLNSSDYLHLLIEVFDHAFADRAHHLGDPDFVEVPVDRLLSEERADEIRRAIWPGRTFPPEHYGSLLAPVQDAGTQHISAVDRDGGAVALTTTINTSFGSGVVVDGLGVILNDEMDDFAAAPGVPNAFGLVGNEANAIAPGKRPLSSMSPTLVYDENDRLVLVLGASGGSTIITGMVQVLLDVLVFGLDPEEAVAAPRVHAQWLPASVTVEPGIPRDVVVALEARGHEVQVTELPTAVQVLRVADGQVDGASDPRKGGRPAVP